MMQQTSNFGPYYVNPYFGIYPNQFAIGHHSTTAAQHATGTPLYGYSYPYHPSLIYPAAVMPVDYVLDEKSDDGMGVSFNRLRLRLFHIVLRNLYSLLMFVLSRSKF